MTFQKGHTGFGKKTVEEDVIKPAEKKKRVPVGLRNPMTVTQELDQNFQYRFVRDKNDRIQQFLAGGYEIVEGNEKVGDPNIAHASEMGKAVTVPSGDAADRVYLMRIPEEFYNEDQMAKESRLQAVEEQLKSKPKEQGFEGKVELNR